MAFGKLGPRPAAAAALLLACLLQAVLASSGASPGPLEDPQCLLQVSSGVAHLQASRGAAPGANVTAAAGSMPLNSAAEMGSPALKVALLVFFLLLPMVLFLLERWLAPCEAPEAPRGPGLIRQTSSDGSSVASREPPAASRAALTSQKSYRYLEPEEKGDFDLAKVFGRMPADSGHVRNLMSGAVISLGCLPEAVSFSMIVGVSPLNGIWAGVFMGLYASLLGGRPGTVSCSSAATAVVLKDLQQTHGMGAMGLAVLLCGCLEVLAGVLYLSRFVSLVPHPVMLGFVNGLAIVIAMAQTSQFRVGGHDGPFVSGDVMTGMIITVIVSMAGAFAFPKLPRIGHLLPGPLVGVVLAIIAGSILDPWHPTRTLIDVAGQDTFAGGLASIPSWDFPPQGVQWGEADLWVDVATTSVRMALVGLVESLLTVKLIDQITGTRGSTRRECFGQGFGNIVAGLFGTQGGCVLIGQSLINVGSGGNGRLSGFAMAAGLAMSVLFLAPVVGVVPVAALVGLMYLVALNTFAWGSLGMLHVVETVDLVVILAVTILTVLIDLATAVIIGLFISTLGFAWSAAQDVRVEEDTDGDETRTFKLLGPLFFGSALSYQNKVRPERIAEQRVVLDFSAGKVLDQSALEAISKTMERLEEAGKDAECTGLGEQAKALINYGGLVDYGGRLSIGRK